jgi:acetate---CoA ligase (ADP-forming) subunit beta
MSSPRTPADATLTLSEHESKQRLAAVGLPIVEERLVADPEAAARAAAALGFPVAVKLCGRAIAHKTERGLVMLGLGDEASVRAGAAELLAAARPEDGDVRILVSRMLRGKRELIAGAAIDRTFGPCVAFGIGGIFAEALADVAFRLAPLERVDAEEMIADIRHRAWLDAFRGEPPVDRARLADVLVGLGRLVAEDPSIVSIDVNPLIVADGVPTAVDALIEVRASASPPAS